MTLNPEGSLFIPAELTMQSTPYDVRSKTTSISISSYNINNKVMGFDKHGNDFSNFYNAELSSSLNIPVWKAITVTPKVAYSFPLSDDAKHAIKNISDDGDKEILYGGVNVTLSF